MIAYQEDLTYSPQYRSLATLADEPSGLTCSVIVGRRWARNRVASVVGYPRFELAAERVLAGDHDVLLVPSAYPDIRKFFFNPELRAVDTFLSTLPDMVFAVPAGAADGAADSDEFDVLYHHPATRALVEGCRAGSARSARRRPTAPPASRPWSTRAARAR
ncbi:hypothetical protein [Saccharothrix hoggarensis]|uniref:Uncharacterized protein n=1 Tax=Saccharothrix hoggarensis TaxID=913853 RepID=A0ABW3QYA8_9PSEU